MSKYCKAYYLKELQQFPAWQAISAEGQADLPAETVVYLQDDLSVVGNPILPNKDVLLSRVTPEWKQFCRTTLRFEIPEEMRYAYSASDEAVQPTRAE